MPKKIQKNKHILILLTISLLRSIRGTRNQNLNPELDPRVIKVQEIIEKKEFCIEKDDYQLIKTSNQATQIYVEAVCSIFKEMEQEDYISENYGTAQTLLDFNSSQKEFLYEKENGTQFSVFKTEHFSYQDMFNELNAGQCLRKKISDPNFLQFLGVVDCVWEDHLEPVFISVHHKHTLRQYIDSIFFFEWERRSIGQKVLTLKVMRMLALEVQQIHKARIAHRNLQVRSIMMDENDFPILSGFHKSSSRGIYDKERVNEEDVIYIDFEMVQGRGNAIWADIYSLGILFGQIVGGDNWVSNVYVMMSQSGWKHSQHMSGFYQPSLQLLKFPQEFHWLYSLVSSPFNSKHPRWDIDKVVSMLDHLYWTYKNELDERIQSAVETKRIAIIQEQQRKINELHMNESPELLKSQNQKSNIDQLQTESNQKISNIIELKTQKIKPKSKSFTKSNTPFDFGLNRIVNSSRKTIISETPQGNQVIPKKIMDSHFISDIGQIQHLEGELDNLSIASFSKRKEELQIPIIEMTNQADFSKYKTWVQKYKKNGSKDHNFERFNINSQIQRKERPPLPKIEHLLSNRSKNNRKQNLNDKESNRRADQKLIETNLNLEEEEYIYDVGPSEYESDSSHEDNHSTVSFLVPFNILEKKKHSINILNRTFVSKSKQFSSNNKEGNSFLNKPIMSKKFNKNSSPFRYQKDLKSQEKEKLSLEKVLNRKVERKPLPDISEFISSRRKKQLQELKDQKREKDFKTDL